MEDNKKEFICKQCSIFLNSDELIDGKCPSCENDEDVFNNDL